MKKHIKHLLIILIILIGVINCTDPVEINCDEITEVCYNCTVSTTQQQLDINWNTKEEKIAPDTYFEVILGDVEGQFYKGTTREKSVSVNYIPTDSLHIQIVTFPCNDTTDIIVPRIIINDIQCNKP